MASLIDFAIAVGIFITFITALIGYLINYFVNYQSIGSTSELRTVAYNLFNSLFVDKGVPRDWAESPRVPLKIGLITDMYRIPLVISENSSTNRGIVTLNLSLAFDDGCDKKAWNNSVRIVNSSDIEIPIRLFNQSFCSQQFLRTADLAFNSSFNAAETKNFSIYFSPDKNITAPNYTLTFPSFVNFTFIIYPEEKLKVVSAERLLALRKLNYTEVLNTLSKDYYVNLEIGD